MAFINSRIALTVVYASAFIGTASADVFTGPVSPYYLTSPSTGLIYVVQGPAVVFQFPTVYGGGEREGALSIYQNTVRTRSRHFLFDPGPAGVYTLKGVPTGVSYPSPDTQPDGFSYYDGTADAVYNYVVEHDHGVYRFDALWQNPEFLFEPAGLCTGTTGTPCDGLSGITYDWGHNTLWVTAKRQTDLLNEYSLDGTLLRSFHASFNPEALAWDGQDNTLWLTNGSNLLSQFSEDGVLLQSGVPAGLPGGMEIYPSGEIPNIPEPSSFVLLAGAVLATIARPWRRRIAARRL